MNKETRKIREERGIGRKSKVKNKMVIDDTNA